MSLFTKYLTQSKGLLVLALGMALISQVGSLIDPQIFRVLTDRYITPAATLPRDQFLQGVIALLLIGIGVALVARTTKNFQDYYVSVITQRLGTRLYADAIRHAFSLPYFVFEDQRSGELLQKLQKARSDVQSFLQSFVQIVFLSTVGIVFVLTYAWIVNIWVGISYVLLIPIVGLTTWLLSKRIKKTQEHIVKETADMAGSTTETLRNVELVKSLGLEHQEISRLNTVNDRILALELKKVRITRTLGFIQGTVVNAMRSLLMLLLVYLIYTKAVTTGEFFSLLFYSFFIFGPLQEIGTVATKYQEMRGSMEQVEKIMAMVPEATPEHPNPLSTLRAVSYQHVGFQYPSAATPAVRDVTLSIHGGETIAFVGPSGSGKTTLVKLLVGLYQATEGTVLLNDTPIGDIDLAAYRRRIGLVSQDTQLFAGTIRDNLLFVNPNATDADCLAVLKDAAALSIIERGDKGLDTRIGESGLKLSGGEKQRLAIARALLRQPEILIFDEATSSLDSLTEASITDTIRTLESTHPHVMTIMVAHRLSTIMHADRIYVLEKGRISETGSHDDLLTKGGLYAALWRQQQATDEDRV